MFALMETIEIGEKNMQWKIIATWTARYTYYSSQSLRAVGRCLSCEEDVRHANEFLSPYCKTFCRLPTITKCQITRGILAPPPPIILSFHFSLLKEMQLNSVPAWKMARNSFLEFPLISRISLKISSRLQNL